MNQVVDEIEDFMATFHSQIASDGATEAMSNLGDSLREASKQAKIAQIFLIEVFLVKGLSQHVTSLGKNDESGVSHALTVMGKQTAIIASNKLKIVESDICTALISLKNKALPAVWTRRGWHVRPQYVCCLGPFGHKSAEQYIYTLHMRMIYLIYLSYLNIHVYIYYIVLLPKLSI